AMLPFCGYNMGDYFKHWLKTGPRLKNPPAIFHVNWFRKGADGKFMWPGFGDNMRVLKWMIDRFEGGGGATESPIGFVPRPEDLDTADLAGMTKEKLEDLLSVKPEEWKKELETQQEFFDTLGADMPAELTAQHDKLAARFAQ
ncbi:MAG TPA: phosphoenolpyruvate carboxykinase domain-containing protein, partial [Chthoniobacterales bacterium]|nr:phosphoenolpyruvate carboxykinase domain-containing protein [Chthoniobacterales bacterium]